MDEEKDKVLDEAKNLINKFKERVKLGKSSFSEAECKIFGKEYQEMSSKLSNCIKISSKISTMLEIIQQCLEPEEVLFVEFSKLPLKDKMNIIIAEKLSYYFFLFDINDEKDETYFESIKKLEYLL